MRERPVHERAAAWYVPRRRLPADVLTPRALSGLGEPGAGNDADCATHEALDLTGPHQELHTGVIGSAGRMLNRIPRSGGDGL